MLLSIYPGFAANLPLTIRRSVADAIGNAIMIAKIATGEIEDITTEDGKNAAAGAHGRQRAGRGHVGEEAERDRQESREKTLAKVKESACKQAEAPQEGDGF